MPTNHTGSVPIGLTKCSVCGEYHGEVREGHLNWHTAPSKPENLLRVSCICDGHLCRRCGLNKVHSPLTNRYIAASNSILHKPYFGSDDCTECVEKHASRKSFSTDDEDETDSNSAHWAGMTRTAKSSNTIPAVTPSEMMTDSLAIPHSQPKEMDLASEYPSNERIRELFDAYLKGPEPLTEMIGRAHAESPAPEQNRLVGKLSYADHVAASGSIPTATLIPLSAAKVPEEAEPNQETPLVLALVMAIGAAFLVALMMSTVFYDGSAVVLLPMWFVVSILLCGLMASKDRNPKVLLWVLIGAAVLFLLWFIGKGPAADPSP